MSAKRRGSKESRARLTLRKEVLRNLSAQDLAQAHGGMDPLGAIVDKLVPRGGQCRYSE